MWEKLKITNRRYSITFYCYCYFYLLYPFIPYGAVRFRVLTRPTLIFNYFLTYFSEWSSFKKPFCKFSTVHPAVVLQTIHAEQVLQDRNHVFFHQGQNTVARSTQETRRAHVQV